MPWDTFPVIHPWVIVTKRPDGPVSQMLISLLLQSFGGEEYMIYGIYKARLATDNECRIYLCFGVVYNDNYIIKQLL